MNSSRDAEDCEVVISVKDVKKTFKSYEDKAYSFKERFINPSRGKHKDIMVLKGISFNVRKGEALGIIGKNGCGKSTTLKLLTRILYPNEGKIEIKGRVSSLIELGAGFHPDMTGRENIYINASIFGITKKEIDTRLNDIIRFSELEEYIDNPVRTYSSGMYMRLAFAVAINVDADVLLIDEILAVGDAGFQRKCFEKLKEIRANGTTIVIVSHSMDQLYQICDRLIWLEQGLIRTEGAPRIIGEQYLETMENERLDRIRLELRQKKAELEEKIQEQRGQDGCEQIIQAKEELDCNETLIDICPFYQPGARRKLSGAIQYTQVVLWNEDGQATNHLLTGQTYRLQLSYEAKETYRNVRFAIGFTREDGVYCYGDAWLMESELSNKGTLNFTFKNGLLKGNYVLDLWIEPIAGPAYDSIYSLMVVMVDTVPDKEKGILSMERSWGFSE